MKEVKQYKLSSLSMAIQKIVQLSITIAIVPILLANFSMVEYANYILIMSISQFYLLDVGVAENLKYSLLHNNSLDKKVIIVNGFVILLFISLFLLFISFISKNYFYSLLNFNEYGEALMIAILISLLIIPLRITREIYSADNKVYKYYFIILSSSVMSLIFLYILLGINVSIISAILAIHGSLLLAHILVFIVSILDKTIVLDIEGISLNTMKVLIPGSINFFLLGIGFMIINGSDIILLSYLIEDKNIIGEFSLVQRLFIYAHMLSMFLISPTWSFLVKIKNTDYSQYKIYLKYIIMFPVFLIFLTTLFFVFYGTNILLIWTGSDIIFSKTIYILLAVYTILRLLTDGLDYYLRINGIINIQSKSTILEALLHVLVSVILFNFYGLSGFLSGSIVALLFTRTLFFIMALKNV